MLRSINTASYKRVGMAVVSDGHTNWKGKVLRTVLVGIWRQLRVAPVVIEKQVALVARATFLTILMDIRAEEMEVRLCSKGKAAAPETAASRPPSWSKQKVAPLRGFGRVRKST